MHRADTEEYTTILLEGMFTRTRQQPLQSYREPRNEDHCALFRYLAPLLAVIERRTLLLFL
jgi:hypothetical protein